ncbi:MAG: SemiSWEET transporter [Candidatus Anstonellaceae archaeon]
MEFIDALGFAAGFFTTVSSLPQVIRSWKTKSTRDLSVGWLAALFTGLSLWVGYGLVVSSTPITISNAISAALVLSLAYLKFRYG